MILLIDCGNSRLKIAWLDAKRHDAVQAPSVFTLDKLDLNALDAWLAALPHPPQHALGVNVAHARRGADITALLQRYGCQIHWLRAQAQTLGLINPYLHPAQLGADRWAGLLGVQARLAQPQPPFLLASFGTATTIDTVGPDQIFAGGLILPGPAMMRKALQEGTAKLPYATGSVAAFPNDTHTAIASGIAAAQAGAVLRQLLASRERYGSTPALYVSGGGWFEVGEELERLLTDIASAFATLLKPMYIDYPVLEGLAALARAQHATLF